MMAVLEDGSIHGTIGGGALEKHVIELCIKAIEEGQSKVIDLPLDTEGGGNDLRWKGGSIYRCI